MPDFHSRQMIWNAVYVLPVPVAMTRSTRFWPFAIASVVRVDGVALVVPGLAAAAVVEVVLKDDLLLLRGEALPPAVDRPQPRRAKGSSSSGRVDSISGSVPVRSWNTKPSPFEEKTNGNVQDLGVVERLLHPVADGVIVVLRLDDGDRDVRLVVEDVVRELRLPPGDHLPADVDLALREVDLPPDLGVLVPTRALDDRRRDELRADVRFAEILLAHYRPCPIKGETWWARNADSRVLSVAWPWPDERPRATTDPPSVRRRAEAEIRMGRCSRTVGRPAEDEPLRPGHGQLGRPS